ncbi:hypothetical protein ABHC40_12460 [Turicibacter sanguinis]|uniref:hypothetical protein n=1 Tax=Turicibacter sanguinis TaxID=154288 RepID=UPI00325BBD2F
MYQTIKSKKWIYSTFGVIAFYFLVLCIHKLIFIIQWPTQYISESVSDPSITAFWISAISSLVDITEPVEELLKTLTLNMEYSLFTSNYIAFFNIEFLMSQLGYFIAVIPVAWIFYYEQSKEIHSLKLIRQSPKRYFNRQLLLVIFVPVIIQLVAGIIDYSLTFIFLYEGRGNLPEVLLELSQYVSVAGILQVSSPFVFSDPLFLEWLTPTNYHSYYWCTMMGYGCLLSSFSLFTYLFTRAVRFKNLFFAIGIPLLISHLIESFISQYIHLAIPSTLINYASLIQLIIIISLYLVLSLGLAIMVRKGNSYV